MALALHRPRLRARLPAAGTGMTEYSRTIHSALDNWLNEPNHGSMKANRLGWLLCILPVPALA